MLPAYQTLSPGLNRWHSMPTSSTVPAASQPRIFGCLGSATGRRRTLVSTGLTETAFTLTRRSRPDGEGLSAVMSTSDSGSSIGSGRWKATAFMGDLRAGFGGAPLEDERA